MNIRTKIGNRKIPDFSLLHQFFEHFGVDSKMLFFLPLGIIKQKADLTTICKVCFYYISFTIFLAT